MLSIAVLGPVEVRRDGVLVPLPSGKTTEVLVRLAIDAGAPVRADRLIEDLWVDVAARTGRNTLQSKVSQLRRALGVPGVITSGTGGYILDVEPGRVDALRVATLATTAGDLRHGGDLAGAAELSEQALALFRGDVLVDAGDGPWLQPHRARLEEVRLGLIEDHLMARVELGAGGDVIGQLEALVRLHPLREGLWHALITALYRRHARTTPPNWRTRARTWPSDAAWPGSGPRACCSARPGQARGIGQGCHGRDASARSAIVS